MHTHNYFRKLKILNTLFFINSYVFRVSYHHFETIFALSLDRFIYVGNILSGNSRNDLRKRTSTLTYEYKFCDKYVRY